MARRAKNRKKCLALGAAAALLLALLPAAGAAELEENPRARSAKLRVAERTEF